jgi:hypothetical protein
LFGHAYALSGLDSLIIEDVATAENCSGGMATRSVGMCENRPLLNSDEQLEITRLARFFPRHEFSLDRTHAIELRGEFFHCCVFADNFTSHSTVQSYLCGD